MQKSNYFNDAMKSYCFRKAIKVALLFASLIILSLNISFSALVPTTTQVTMAQGQGSTPQYSCNVLYASPDGTNNPLYQVDLRSAPGGTGVVQAIALFNTGAGTYNATIALGPAGSASGPMTMFFWYFTTGITRAVQQGDTTVYDMLPNKPNAANGYGWSGGEVNQLTGEIFFSGQEGTTTDGANYWSLMKSNPTTGNYVRNPGRIPPQTPSDRPAQNRLVSSDMAIDANGNVYVLAYSGNNKSIIRYNVTDTDPSKWTYTTVFEFPSGTLNLNGVVWGMAFLNGRLYLATSTRYLYEVNL